MYRRLLHFACLTLLLAWSTAGLGQGNIMLNGEFDEDLDSWGIYGGAGFTVSVVQDAALSGYNAALIDITNAGAGNSIGIAQGQLPLEQGKTYPIGFTAKAGQDREMVILMQLYDPAGPSWTDLFLERVSLTTEAQEYVLEYTHQRDSTADHPDWSIDIYFMLKGPYWSMVGSNLNTKVWLDRIYMGEPDEPQERTKAVGPTPTDGAAIETPYATLEWMPGDYAVSHDVYFGDNFDDVNEGNVEVFSTTRLFLPAGTAGGPYPDGLTPGTTYYWRVDEVNEDNPDSPWKGDVWSFLIRSKAAWQPSPPDEAQLVRPDQKLVWEKGLGAIYHQVHFGQSFEAINAAPPGTGWPTINPEHDPGELEVETTYYWRVDEFDGAQWHIGPVWSFTTVPLVPVTDPDLAGWWTLDETVGTTAVDWSGHGNHGAIVGEPPRVDGYFGGALEIAQDGQYVNCGTNAGQDITNDFTVGAWVKQAPGNFAVYGGIAGQLIHPGPYLGFSLVRHSSNVLRLWIGDGTDDLAKSAVSSDELYLDTEWHHVAAVREGQINSMYVDGVKQAATSETDFAPSTGWFHIGRQYSDIDGRFFRGLIDDVRLYSKALTEAEIAEAMRGDPLLAAALEPSPVATVDIREAASLRWLAGSTAATHDVYFGTDKDAVAAADRDAPEYQGNQPGTSLPLGGLVEFGGGAYYWRIDEVEADGTTIHQGAPWKFTVPAYLIVDDFESYTDEVGQRVFEVWVDGAGYSQPEPGHPGNGSGALVGHDIWSEGTPYITIVEIEDVHGGGKAMPLYYNNTAAPYYSEAERTWSIAQDWTIDGADTLTLYVRGVNDNDPDPLYVALEDAMGNMGVVPHPDGALANALEWTQWSIPLSDFSAAGVTVTAVKKMYIGVGNRTAPSLGGTGVVFVDDVRVTVAP